MAAALPESGTSTTGYVDTHCHVDEVFTQLKMFPPYDPTSVTSAFGEACEAVVAQFCDPAAFSPSLAMFPELLGIERVYGAFGLHPHHAKYWNDALATRILEALEHEKAIAYGEFGLDFKVNRSTPAEQEACFTSQLALALSLERPRTIVLHCGNAEERMLELMLEGIPAERRPELRIHLHCYTGSAKLAKRFLEEFPMLFLGLTGFVTYSSGAHLRAALGSRDIPLDRVLLETDGPHMFPEEEGGKKDDGKKDGAASTTKGGGRKKRGRGSGRKPTTTPKCIPTIAAVIAKAAGTDLESVLTQVRENTRNCYGL
jgi:TatD DNase family protein